MPQTTTVTVSSHIMTEILGQLALKPLFNKYVLLPWLNRSNIDGLPSKTRKIAKRTKLAEAEDDDEGVAIADSEQMGYGTPISLTPTKKRKRINTTIDALQLRMPGATREQVIMAIESGSATALPMLSEQAELIRDAHLQRAERESMLLLGGLSESAGTTNVALSFASVVDGQTKLLDNNPEHEAHIIVIDEKGVGDLRASVVTGTGPSVASAFGDGFAKPFLDIVGDPNRVGFRGSVLGAPVYAGDRNLMTTANGVTDRQGGIVLVGRGEVGGAGSLRGFAEFCEGFAQDLRMVFNLLGDDVDVVGRWKWIVAEHTDEHGVGLIYKAT